MRVFGIFSSYWKNRCLNMEDKIYKLESRIIFLETRKKTINSPFFKWKLGVDMDRRMAKTITYPGRGRG